MLLDRLNEDFISSYKNRDTVKLNTLKGIRTAMANWKANKKNVDKEMTDADIIGILTTEAKKRKDAIDIYGSQDNVAALVKKNQEKAELEVIQSYLPAQLTEEEIKNMVTEYVEENYIIPPGDVSAARTAFGAVMKQFTTQYKGQYEPQTLKRIAEGVLELNNG